MRISNNTLYDLGINTINSQLTTLVKTQQQVSTGRRILTPADDPVASATALETDSSLSVAKQQLDNIGNARSTLSLEESVVSNINRVYQDARQTIVSAGNSGLSASDRATLATTLRSNYNELLTLANSRDGQGNYFFSGFASSTQPFTQTTGAAVYAGDQGQRKLQITPSRQIDISDSGQDLFKPGVAGADPFASIEKFITALGGNTAIGNQVTTGTGATNSGSASIATAVSATATPPTSAVTLTYNAGSTSFTTVSQDPAWNNLTIAYTNPTTTSINGVSFTISGTPSNNDKFTLNNATDAALGGIDTALNNALRVQSSIGSRLNELDSTQTSNQDTTLQYQTKLSSLRDVDLTRAISDLTQQQNSLQAAQKSFLSIQGLSLFKLL